MDGDAWGSLGWLALILRNMWKEVQAINDDPVPEFLNFLGHNHFVNPELDVENFAPDLIISLDAAGTDRLWKSYENWKYIFDETPFVVIDHHISNPGFGNVNIIDPEASSVCEILTHLLAELWLQKNITSDAATFFYTGLQTDTNMYATSNTTANTLKAWALLIELWANFRLPIEKCFRQKSLEQIQAQQIAYKNLEISQCWKISYSIITQENIKNSSLDISKLSEYLKWFINETLINIEWVKVAFLLYPLENGEIKWSMRSQDGYDVNTICQKFWGWGHIQAAGFQSSDSSEKIVDKLLEEINKATH